MANEINRELKNYYGEISKVLICSGREKREIINSIKESVSCYLNEHPEADIDEIRSIFGTSKEVAEEYLNNETAESIRTKIKRGNAVILTVIAYKPTGIKRLTQYVLTIDNTFQFRNIVHYCLACKLID